MNRVPDLFVDKFGILSTGLFIFSTFLYVRFKKTTEEFSRAAGSSNRVFASFPLSETQARKNSLKKYEENGKEI